MYDRRIIPTPLKTVSQDRVSLCSVGNLELAMYARLALDSQKSVCLYHLDTGTTQPLPLCISTEIERQMHPLPTGVISNILYFPLHLRRLILRSLVYSPSNLLPALRSSSDRRSDFLLSALREQIHAERKGRGCLAQRCALLAPVLSEF